MWFTLREGRQRFSRGLHYFNKLRHLLLINCYKMTMQVQDVIAGVKNLTLPPDFLYNSIDEFLRDYSIFIFTKTMKGKSAIYRDLEKKVTPYRLKRTLQYLWSNLVPEIEAEQMFLMDVCNTMKKILCIVGPKRKKRFILSVLEEMYQATFSTGGGTPARVRRIIIIFETEGGVVAKRRSSAAMEALYTNINAHEQVSHDHWQNGHPCKKQKQFLDDNSTVTEEDCKEVLDLLGYPDNDAFDVDSDWDSWLADGFDEFNFLTL